ncbi:heme exporter protein A [Devosia subaequoris]|uniref:Heme exporter protein A n=1 Tax=Devosia subaequoris TaxID=395930 RepID=A0A7W6INI5_9HYPH|nr:heme ABC exporter ATP-binding protein CcmA [Devosia subaequoris]MBB4052447.1 heme exporter protein A [Devosia subaequoris]MCP1209607.1 heme ABC exporter ATP-binding protein CcmA [Devosia subaequoris]
MTQGQVQHRINLKTQALACGRGDAVLVADLSLEVAAGSALLLRGPNGAGKSTLLLTLAGLLRPISGTLVFEGADPEAGPFIHHCGHKNAVRPRLTVLETLRFWADLNGSGPLPPAAALERVGLARTARVDAGYLSAGQQRRLVLARLLVSPRPVWLLDEPSAALDAAGRELMAALLVDHLESGGLAVIATHDDIALPGAATLTLGAEA